MVIIIKFAEPVWVSKSMCLILIDTVWYEHCGAWNKMASAWEKSGPMSKY